MFAGGKDARGGTVAEAAVEAALEQGAAALLCGMRGVVAHRRQSNGRAGKRNLEKEVHSLPPLPPYSRDIGRGNSRGGGGLDEEARGPCSSLSPLPSRARAVKRSGRRQRGRGAERGGGPQVVATLREWFLEHLDWPCRPAPPRPAPPRPAGEQRVVVWGGALVRGSQLRGRYPNDEEQQLLADRTQMPVKARAALPPPCLRAPLLPRPSSRSPGLGARSAVGAIGGCESIMAPTAARQEAREGQRAAAHAGRAGPGGEHVVHQRAQAVPPPAPSCPPPRRAPPPSQRSLALSL